MKNEEKIYNSLVTKLHAYEAEHNRRPSPVRLAVLQQAWTLPQPFTAEQLQEACLAERISLGTVYNCLAMFQDASILHTIERQRGKAVREYELVVDNLIRMQLVCERCGRVSHIHDKAIERIVKAKKVPNFIKQHFTLIIYGQCKRCKGLELTKQEV